MGEDLVIWSDLYKVSEVSSNDLADLFLVDE